jgi:hypothetical protein
MAVAAIPKASIIHFLLDQQRDSAGLLNGGKVYFYNPGTTDMTGIHVWLDPSATIPANNPYTLNANGTAQIYAHGFFRIVITDSDGIPRMDYDNLYFNSSGDYDETVNVSDYSDLESAIAAIGSARVSLRIDIPLTVLGNLTVPGNIVLLRSEAGSITVGPGATLTIVTAPSSPPTPWFYGSGTVVVVGYPQEAAWWGSNEKTTYVELATTENLVVGGNSTVTGTFSAQGFPMPVTGWHYRNQQHIDNLGISAAVSNGALTITLTDASGGVPSALSPVSVAMRDSLLNIGDVAFKYATVVKTFTLSSGSTLGFAASQIGRIYVWAIGNGNSFDLGVSRTTDIFPETNIYTTTAEGGTGTADSATTLYSTAVLTGAIRCIGYIEITCGPAVGQWLFPPTKIQLMGPGVPRTGDMIQTVTTVDTTYKFTALASCIIDNTIPMWGQGYLFLTHGGIIPTSIMNLLRIDVWANMGNSTSRPGAAMIFQNSAGPAISSSLVQRYDPDEGPVTMRAEKIANTVSNTVFQFCMGTQPALPLALNGTTGGPLLGGSIRSYISVTEICV